MFRRKGSGARTSPSSTPARGWGDRGVTAVEYALIASLVVLVTFGAVRLLNNAASNSYNSAETQIGDPATICSIDKWYNATEDRCDPKTACDTATQWYDVDTNTCAAFAICTSPTAWRNPLTNTCEATADCSASPGTYLDTASNTCLTIQGASAPNVSAVAGVKRVDLSWTAPTVTGGSAITGYSVQRSLDGTTWTNITYASALPPATTLPVTGLLDGTKYFFQVAAITTVTGAYGSAVATTTGQPVVTAVTPNSGPLGGGTLITITGTGFMTGATVTLGSSPGIGATNVTMVNSTRITARTPPGASGGKAVTVTNPNTLAGTLPSPAFTYVASPSATTLAATNVTSSTARLNGTVNANGASTTVTFCYGLSTTLSTCTPVNATPLTVTGASPTSVLANVSGLTANRNYYFRVSAVNANGTTPGSIMQFTTLPALPTGQAVSSPSKGRLTVSWSTIPNDGGSPPAIYRVQIDPMTGATCSTNTADYGSDQTTTAGTLTFTGLTGLKYCAWVRAENSAGTSAWTPPAGPMAVLAPTAPGAPTGLVGTPGNGSVALSWTAPADNGGSAITDYVVQYSQSSTFTSGVNTFTDGVSIATTATVTGLSNSTNYYFRVAAKNAIGTGSNSAISAVVRPGATVPGAPTGLTRTSGNRSVALSWTAPADNGGSSITDYVVQYSTSRTGGWATFADGVSTNTTATVTGLTNGTLYYFRVAAKNAVGTGAYSTISAGVRPVASPPLAPGRPTGTRGNQTVALAWTVPTDDGGAAITDYLVRYSTSSTGPWTSFPDGVSTGLTATVTGLTNGTTYYFQVAAKNSTGTGAYSASSVGLVPATTPTAPSITTVTDGNQQLSLAFSTPMSDGGSAITTYQYSTDGGSTWKTRTSGNTGTPIVITQTSAAGTTALTNCATYSLRIQAVNAVGAGDPSSTVSAIPGTLPAAPTIGTITRGDAQLSVAFTAGSAGSCSISTYEYSTDGGSTWQARGSGSTGSPLVITDTSASGTTALSNCSTYTVQLRALSLAGTGPASGSASGIPGYAPGAPTIGTIVGSRSGSNGVLTVPITLGTAGSCSNSNIEYSTDNGTTWKARSPASMALSLVILTVSGSNNNLARGTTYSVKVRIVSPTGTSAESAMKQGTTT